MLRRLLVAEAVFVTQFRPRQSRFHLGLLKNQPQSGSTLRYRFFGLLNALVRLAILEDPLGTMFAANLQPRNLIPCFLGNGTPS